MFSFARQVNIYKIFSILYFRAYQSKHYSFDVPTHELIYFIKGECEINFKGNQFVAKKVTFCISPNAPKIKNIP